MMRLHFDPTMLICVHLWLLLGAMSSPVAASPDTVERRGGQPALHGDIVQIDDGGIMLQSDLGARHFISWDRVRDVSTRTRADEVAAYRETADSLWRARSRIERNDTALAEPLLGKVFEVYRGRTNETALVVAEGLLRCRLARGAQALCVVPALETARLKRAGVRTISYSQLSPVIDADTELCMNLSPYWLDSPILRSVYQDLVQYDAQGDAVIAELARLYAESIRRALSGPDSPEPPVHTGKAGGVAEHQGVEFMTRILACGADEAEARDEARRALLADEPSVPDFQKAWLRFHVGLSLLNETGIVRRQRGVANLLHLPALYAETQPYLAGVALDRAAAALEGQGNTEAAAALRNELAAVFPFHPVRTLDIASQ